MIFIQAECLPEENLAELALVLEQIAIDPRIAGMVAYAGLEQGKSSLSPLIGNAFVKGVRRMYDDTPDVCCSPLFLEAARELPRLGLSMDISAKPLALPYTARMIGQCPETQFILDHLGKPDIRNGASIVSGGIWTGSPNFLTWRQNYPGLSLRPPGISGAWMRWRLISGMRSDALGRPADVWKRLAGGTVGRNLERLGAGPAGGTRGVSCKRPGEDLAPQWSALLSDILNYGFAY